MAKNLESKFKTDLKRFQDEITIRKTRLQRIMGGDILGRQKKQFGFDTYH